MRSETGCARSWAGCIGPIACVALSILLLAGCRAHTQTVVVWEPAAATEMELENALAWCRAQGARKKGASVRGDRYAADQFGAGFVRCMRAKGWTWKTRELPIDESEPAAGAGADSALPR